MQGRKHNRAGVAIGAVVAALVMASSAAGSPAGDTEPRPTPSPMPDLIVTAAAVTAPSSTQWEVAYTVKNNGNAPAPSSSTAIRLNGSTVLTTRSTPGIAAWSSYSDRVRVTKTGCYIPVEVAANSGRTFYEKYSTNNARWAVGVSDPACTTAPSYRVKAIGFRADDESHWDKAGSDEPYFVFSSVGTDGTARTTTSRVFGDVDSGESRTFATTEGCIWTSGCGSARAPYGIGISIQLWERDYGADLSEIRARTSQWFGKAGYIRYVPYVGQWLADATEYIYDAVDAITGWAEDDIMGTTTFAYDAATLARSLRSAGSSFSASKYLGGAAHSGGADYRLTLQVTRVA